MTSIGIKEIVLYGLAAIGAIWLAVHIFVDAGARLIVLRERFRAKRLARQSDRCPKCHAKALIWQGNSTKPIDAWRCGACGDFVTPAKLRLGDIRRTTRAERRRVMKARKAKGAKA